MRTAGIAVLMSLALLLACQSTQTVDVRQTHSQLLVTFIHSHHNFTPPPTGSSHVYHAGRMWSSSPQLQSIINSVEREYGIRELDAWPIKTLGLYCVVFEIPAGESLSGLLTLMAEDDAINSAQAMHSFRAMTAEVYDDPKFELQYGQYTAVVESLHQHTRGDRIRVGIVDSMVDVEHPDLQGQISRHYNFVDAQPRREKSHGTAVTGVIAAAAGNGKGIVGLAPEAVIHVYAACTYTGEDTRCTSFTLAKAIEQAIEDRIDVLNLSLAGPHDALLQALISRARQGGMIILAAQNPSPRGLNFPASMTEVVAVSGANSAGKDNTRTPWFARAEQLSTKAGGGYQFYYGSSVASAGATGLAVLLRAYWQPEQAEYLLYQMMNSPCDSDQATAKGKHFIATLKQASLCEDSARSKSPPAGKTR